MVICLKKKIKKYIISNLKSITSFVFIYLIGIVIGFFIYSFMNENIKLELIEQTQKVFEIVKNEKNVTIDILKNGIKNNLIFAIIITFTVFCYFCNFLIYSFLFLKGISFSIYTCLIFGNLGISSGILALIFIIMLPNVLQLIAYVFLGNEVHSLNLNLLEEKERINCRFLLKLLLNFILTIPFCIFSVFVEQIFFKILIGG